MKTIDVVKVAASSWISITTRLFGGGMAGAAAGARGVKA